MSTKNFILSSIQLIILIINLSSAAVKHQTDCPIKITSTLYSPKTDYLKNRTIDDIAQNKAINSSLNKINSNEDDKKEIEEDQQYYQCPGNIYDDEYISCCPDVNECCIPEKRPSFIMFPIDNDKLPKIIVIGVISVCVLVVLIIFLCCFWSMCPLYNSCRIRYYHDESSCADKLGESQINYSMPGELLPSTNTIVINKKFDSDQIEEKKVITNDSLIEPIKFSSNKKEFAV